MFEKIEIFQMAGNLARHASARQDTIAQNVANADTPGYRAKDIQTFSQTYRSDASVDSMRTTRAGHLGAVGPENLNYSSYETDDPVSPNGNSVSLETEMVKASEVRQQHDMALSIYSKSMDILRSSLGSR